MKTATLPSASPAAQSPLRLGDVLRVLGASLSWALLIALVLLTALAVGWILLGVVLLGVGPSADADPPPLIVAPVLLGITGALAWLVTRFFASARRVGLVIGAILVLLFVAGATWTLAAPDQALFLARDIAWGPSDVWDYQKFPERVVNNAPQIISEQWVKESTSPYPTNPNGAIAWHANTWFSDWRAPTENGVGYYKYQWWGRLRPDGSYDFIASGHLGQRIYVSPQYNAVAVRFGISEGGVDTWEEVMASVVGKVQ